MERRGRFFRPNSADEQLVTYTNALIEETRSLLARLPRASTFLGRETHVPFPRQEDAEKENSD